MDEIKLKKIGLLSRYHSFIRKIYADSFPKKERAPYSFLLTRTILGTGELYLITNNDCPVGFSYLANDEKAVYLYYFAISEQYRSSGCGGQALELMKKSIGGG